MSRRHADPADPGTVMVVNDRSSRSLRSTAWRLVPYSAAAVALGLYLRSEAVPSAGWVAAGTFVLLVALGESYRALSPRLGHATALAALCLAFGVVGGLFAVFGWACEGGTCSPSETGTAILSGLFTPLTVWLLFAPPVIAVRALRRLWRRRATVVGWVWGARRVTAEGSRGRRPRQWVPGGGNQSRRRRTR